MGVRFCLIAAAVLLLAFASASSSDVHADNTIDFVGLDFKVTGNTASSVGFVNDCTDGPIGMSFQVDIVAKGIPAAMGSADGLYGLDFTLHYPASVRVTGYDAAWKLNVLPGGVISTTGDSVPDMSPTFAKASSDTGPNRESGDGVLARITFQSISTAFYTDPIYFSSSEIHVYGGDAGQQTYGIDALQGSGYIFVNDACNAITDQRASNVVTQPAPLVIAGASFQVDVSGDISQVFNYESPLNTDIAFTMTPPADCGAMQSFTLQNQAIDQVPVHVSHVFAVSCSSPGLHSFTGTVRPTLDDPTAVESNPGNNLASDAGTNTIYTPLDGPYAGYPDSMAALGDSITQGTDTTSFGDHPEDSWATGTNPAVNSLYTRLLAVHPGATRFNDSVSGARMNSLNTQAQQAVTQGAELVVILMGANDVCTTSEANMTPVATLQIQFQTAIETLTQGLPNARIAVASIPDVYNLWSILHDDPNAQFVWSFANICQSLLVNPTSMAPADVQRRANVRQRNIDFNTALEMVCDEYVHCLFDDNAGFNTVFTPSDVSGLDYFHPSIQGQALAASTGWANSYDFTDAMPPVSTASGTASPGGATVTLSATDAVGVRGIEYKLGSGPYVRYAAPLALAAGTHITWRAVDVNGNTEATHNCTVQLWGWVAGDEDCDGFSNAAESFLATDAIDGCAETTATNDEPDDWPSDFNDSTVANTLDLVVYATAINRAAGHPQYVARADLNGNGVINTLDLVPYAAMLNKACLP